MLTLQITVKNRGNYYSEVTFAKDVFSLNQETLDGAISEAKLQATKDLHGSDATIWEATWEVFGHENTIYEDELHKSHDDDYDEYGYCRSTGKDSYDDR